jgi:hypothetical protein
MMHFAMGRCGARCAQQLQLLLPPLPDLLTLATALIALSAAVM